MTKQSILGIYEDQLLNFSHIVVSFTSESNLKGGSKCRNVKIIVPYAVGTATDLIFRAFWSIN